MKQHPCDFEFHERVRWMVIGGKKAHICHDEPFGGPICGAQGNTAMSQHPREFTSREQTPDYYACRRCVEVYTQPPLPGATLKR